MVDMGGRGSWVRDSRSVCLSEPLLWGERHQFSIKQHFEAWSPMCTNTALPNMGIKLFFEEFNFDSRM